MVHWVKAISETMQRTASTMRGAVGRMYGGGNRMVPFAVSALQSGRRKPRATAKDSHGGKAEEQGRRRHPVVPNRRDIHENCTAYAVHTTDCSPHRTGRPLHRLADGLDPVHHDRR